MVISLHFRDYDIDVLRNSDVFPAFTTFSTKWISGHCDAGKIQKMCGAGSMPGPDFGENLTSLVRFINYFYESVNVHSNLSFKCGIPVNVCHKTPSVFSYELRLRAWNLPVRQLQTVSAGRLPSSHRRPSHTELTGSP